MASISVAALLAILALVGVTSARPGGTDGATADGNGHGRVQLQQPDHTALEEVAIPLYRAADTKSPHKEHSGGGKLSIVHLIMIIGKVIAPLVGAIVEPLLINIVKGITWAITYSLASGFDKPPSYEHFVPALIHHGGGGAINGIINGVSGGNGGGGGGGGGGDDDDDYDNGGSVGGGDEYESHKPVAYSLKQLPELALQLTSTVLSESSRPDREQAVENAERNLAGLLAQRQRGEPVLRR